MIDQFDLPFRVELFIIKNCIKVNPNNSCLFIFFLLFRIQEIINNIFNIFQSMLFLSIIFISYFYCLKTTDYDPQLN